MAAWTRTARLLHWATALAVLVEAPAGLAMSWTYVGFLRGGPQAWIHVRTSQIHHTLGLLLLAATLLRLAWRLRHPAPPPPAPMGRATRRTAAAVQFLLYALLILLPLSGWAALSSLAAGTGYPAPSLWFFTQDEFGPGGMIPHLVSPKPWGTPGLLTYATFAPLHRWGAWLGGVALTVHGAGALYHHFIRRDAVLVRMLWGTRPDVEGV